MVSKTAGESSHAFKQRKTESYCSKECRPTTKGIKFSDKTKKLMSDIKKKLYEDPTKNPAYQRTFKHTEETKRKISISLSNKY